MTEKIIGAVIAVVTAAVYGFLTWLLSLSWNLHFATTWINITIIVGILVGCISLFTYKEGQGVPKFVKYLFGVPVLLAAGIGVMCIKNSPLFSAKSYYNYIAERVTVVEESEEQSAFPDLLGGKGDTSNLPLYGDPEAIKKAETEMGKYPALGSQFELLDYDLTSQNINGKLSYVIPLQPKSMFKWEKEEGNHGYFIIDRNTGETQFVDHSLMYTTQAPFGSSVMRVLRKFDRTSGITDVSPEVDDEGVFHYVATTYDQDGMNGLPKVTGILDLNAQTGEITRYGMDEIPAYVDRVYPEEFFVDYISYYGKYQSGFINSVIGQKGVQEATDSYDVIYIDGTCYYYTGWTSTGKHESSNGIMMMNSRTGEMTLYRTYGISEAKAQGVAEGKVQEKEYSASYPLLLKVAGEETYFSIMRDKNDNLCGYAFVSYKDYTKVAVGDTLSDTQNLYIKSIANSNSSSVFEDAFYETANGKIAQIASEVVDGTTIYYLTLEGDTQMYSFYSKLEPRIVFAKAGDEIELTYVPAESDVIAATEVKLK